MASRGRKRKKTGSLWTRMGSIMAGFLLGREVDEETGDRLQEIKGLFLIGFCLWLALSLATYYAPYGDPVASGNNWGGEAGHYLAHAFLVLFGLGGYLVAFLGLAWGFVILARKEVAWPALRIFGGLLFVVSCALLLQLGFGPEVDLGEGGIEWRGAGLGPRLPYGPGGWLALESTPELVAKFGNPGLWVLLLLAAMISFMLATQMAFYPAIAAFGEWLDERREERDESLLAAVAGWSGRLVTGLWNFLRGSDLEGSGPVSDLEDDLPEVTPKKTRGKSKAKPKAKAKPKSKAAKKKAAAAVDPEEEDEDEGEWEEDEEWEYEDDPEAELDDDDWEEEETEEYEEEWEYEDEEEDPVVLQPAAKAKPKAKAKAKAKPKAKAEEKAKAKAKVARAMTAELPFDPPTPPPGPWSFPPIELLEKPAGSGGVDEEFLERSATKLENVLRSFKVDAAVEKAQVGPAVTLFELSVAEGTRMNKVTALSQEIAAALKAKSVRIIAPIPGKSTIGIEVPNSKRRLVRLSELITQDAYDSKKWNLPLFLGMDAEGTAIVEDLARMPHLLIAGTTGSGKSVCINTILASMLLTRSPHDVKMVLVDPKMVELQMYSKVPHLLLPVVTDMRQATNVLLWACEKMEGRYELFKDCGVRNIKGFNALGEDELRTRLGDDFSDERTPRHLPYMVVVIDEMADLMMTSKKEAEQTITRLAQKSRAVGIHVIVATQRPSTDVITGVLKGNLPTRIAFQVASKIDSRVILDVGGAEKLLGGGDMLYTPPQSSQVSRVQGALVEDHELQAIIDFVCEESLPNFSQELIQSASGTSAAGAGTSAALEDELWDDAVRVILKSKRGSASLLQRALGIGYTRASRLLDMMSEEGIVGDHKGSKAREVMLTIEDWEEMHGTPLGQGVSDE